MKKKMIDKKKQKVKLSVFNKKQNYSNNKYNPISQFKMAERKGFEPLIRIKRIHAFQACSLNHSDTFPMFSIIH